MKDLNSKRQVTSCNRHLKLIGLLLSAALLCGFLSMESYAREERNLEENVYEVTRLLEQVFEAEYEETKKELKSIIVKEDYDYYRTMESVTRQEHPFRDIDYLDLIAVYTVVKDYCNLEHISIKEGLAGIPFLELTVEEQSVEVLTPILMPAYKEIEPGVYVREGNQKISKPTKVPIMEAKGKETYQKTGEITIAPEKEVILYGEATISNKGIDAIYDYYGIDKNSLQAEFKAIRKILEKEINGEALEQSVFVQTPKSREVLSEDILRRVGELTKDLSGTEAALIQAALSLVGQVPYQWGGKPIAPGYDNSWWLFDETGNQKGLDCSGFVHWVYMTAGFNKEVTDLATNSWTLMSVEDTPFEELQPGDIGILNHNEEGQVNHLGVYLGEDLFIHCSSGAGTVTVSPFPFTYFKKVQNLGTVSVDNINCLEYDSFNYTLGIQNKNGVEYREEDINLLAKVMIHEAGNQGYNGKVAVGEVLINRMDNPKFKEHSLYDVVYAKNQISYVENLDFIIPDEETLSIAEMVLSGQTRIFNNPDVLYYKNSMITDKIAPSEPVDWGNAKWFTFVNDHAFYLG